MCIDGLLFQESIFQALCSSCDFKMYRHFSLILIFSHALVLLTQGTFGVVIADGIIIYDNPEIRLIDGSKAAFLKYKRRMFIFGSFENLFDIKDLYGVLMNDSFVSSQTLLVP